MQPPELVTTSTQSRRVIIGVYGPITSHPPHRRLHGCVFRGCLTMDHRRDALPCVRERRRNRPLLLPLFWSILFYIGSLASPLLDGLVHVRQQASVHSSRPHYEDPAKQSHSDRCLLARPACSVQIGGWGNSAIRYREEVTTREHRISSRLVPHLYTELPLARAPPV